MKYATIIFLCLALMGQTQAQTQTFRLGWRSVTATPRVRVSIVGADSLSEGTSQTYRVILTAPNGTTANVTTLANLTVSRGASNGLTASTENYALTLTSAPNTHKGDHRITTLSATYRGFNISREIVLRDATVSTSAIAPRMVTSADIAKWPQMKLGDFLIGGATTVSGGDHSINIQTSQSNVPTLSPGATIWIKGAKYNTFTLQLNQSRVPDGQPYITIRNYDGQVEIKGSMTLLGAQGVKTSGKYIAGVGGDSDYRGHDAGYAFSDRRYGILLNNQWSDLNKPGLYAYNGVRNLEYEYIQVTQGYFAGVQINSDNYDMSIPGSTVHVNFDNMSFHDLLINNVDSEGIYVGSTGQNDQKAFYNNLKVYNNRILFVGSETMQIGQAKSVEVYNNVTLGTLLWRENFQPFQDNNSQHHARYPKALFKNNLTLGAGEKFINGQTQIDSLASYAGADADTIVWRNNAFLYNRGIVYAYYNTRTTYGTKPALVGANLKFENNLMGFQRFTYNQVYSSTTEQPYLFQFDVISAKIYLLNNTFDGSSTVKNTLFTNSQAGTTPVTQSGNTLSGSVPTPEFENLAGSISLEKLARIEYWEPTSGTNYGTNGIVKGPVTFPAGELCTHKGFFYEAKQAATAIEPGVTAGWQTYWDVLYWNRSTGALVRNPSSTAGLSAIPPMDVRTKGFYKNRGIGLLN